MNKEDEIALFRQDLKEFQSSLNILLSAVKNEFNPPELIEIEDLLEILVKNFDRIVKKSKNILTK